MDNFVSNYKDLISYVSENPEINNIIDPSQFYPLFTTDTKKSSVVTNLTPTQVGVICTANLEFKVISPSRDKANEIANEIMKIMAMKDSKYKVHKGVYFYSEYVSSGELFNPEYRMYENPLIFNIKWRCI